MKTYLITLLLLLTTMGVYAKDSSTHFIALLNLDAKGIDKDFADLISDALISEINQQRGYQAMERSKVNEILSEQGFQESGACTSECQVEMGQLLGIDQMVVGSIGKFDGTYIINLRRLDLQTGEIISSSTQSVEGSVQQVMTEAIPKLISEVCPHHVNGVAQLQSTPSSQQPIIQKGPASANLSANSHRDGLYGAFSFAFGPHSMAYDPDFDEGSKTEFGVSAGFDIGYGFWDKVPIFTSFRTRSSEFDGNEMTASIEENYAAIGAKYFFKPDWYMGLKIGRSVLGQEIDAASNIIENLQSESPDTAKVFEYFQTDEGVAVSGQEAINVLKFLHELSQDQVYSKQASIEITAGTEWRLNPSLTFGLGLLFSTHKSDQIYLSPRVVETILLSDNRGTRVQELFEDNELQRSALTYNTVGLELRLIWH